MDNGREIRVYAGSMAYVLLNMIVDRGLTFELSIPSTYDWFQWLKNDNIWWQMQIAYGQLTFSF